MILISNNRMVAIFLYAVAVVAGQKVQEEVDEEETRTVNTFATRSDDGQRAQIVTGTFR